MTKYIADIITGFRILGSVALLFFPAFSLPFCILYLLCGLSDMIDGTVARKTNSVSSFGSILDTVADFIFMTVCVFKLLPVIQLPVWLWIWIAVIAIIKGINIVFGFTYRKKLVAYHTALNKATGLLLFLLPFTLRWIKSTYSLATVCAVAIISAIQEGYYIIKNNR